MGSGCGSVGSAIVRELRFEFGQMEFFYYQLHEKMNWKNEKKKPEMAKLKNSEIFMLNWLLNKKSSKFNLILNT